MIILTQSTPILGDCTAGYAVSMDRTYTVREFIQEILSDHNREWGYIGISPINRDKCSIFGDPKCEYRYGKLISHLPEDVLERTIQKAKADGGWSRMDYLLYLEIE